MGLSAYFFWWNLPWPSVPIVQGDCDFKQYILYVLFVLTFSEVIAEDGWWFIVQSMLNIVCEPHNWNSNLHSGLVDLRAKQLE